MTMTMWEYRTERIDSSGMYLISRAYNANNDPYHPDSVPSKWDSINLLGAEGWELVAVGWDGDEGNAIFKRMLNN